MIKSISFIVLTHFHFFHFNELKILRQPGYFFFKLNQQYFFKYKVLLSNGIKHLKIYYKDLCINRAIPEDMVMVCVLVSLA